jgi:hypothetical protein
LERREFQVADAARQGFGALVQQLGRGRAKQQKLARPLSRLATLVDQTSQHRKQVWQALDFVEDDQLIGKARKVKLRVCQLGEIRGTLQIQIMRGFSEIQAPRQSRLAHLAGAQQGHRRGLAEALDQRAVEVTENHFGLKIRNPFLKFKANLGKKSEWRLPANHGLGLR